MTKFIVAVMCVASIMRCYASPPVAASEFQIKSVFLYNFVNFVTWPDSAFDNSDAPFYICVLGKDPFGVFLDATTEGQTVEEHPLVVERIENASVISTCHILFVSDSEQSNLNQILTDANNYNILTVSDISGFVTKGGMIEFFSANNKVRVAINPDALKAVGLQADANLLKLAKIVKP